MRLIDSEAFKDYIVSNFCESGMLDSEADLLEDILLELDVFPGISVTVDKDFSIVVNGEL